MALFYDPNNVVVGVAVLNLAPYDADTPVTPPATTVAWDQTWDAPWFSTGATDQGYSVSGSRDLTSITIEEQPTPVTQTAATANMTITAALAEETMQNLALYFNGTLTGTDGAATLTLSDDILYYTAAFLWRIDSTGATRRLFIPRVTVAGTDTIAFRRADNKHMYGLTVSSACATNQMTITEVAAPTG